MCHDKWLWGGSTPLSMFCVCWWGLHETPEPDLSHESILGWGAVGNPLSTVSQTCHLPARNADESPFHHETRHQATSCQEHPKYTPALASGLWSLTSALGLFIYCRAGVRAERSPWVEKTTTRSRQTHTCVRDKENCWRTPRA